MTDNQDSGGAGDRNIRIDARRLIFEVRIVLDSVAAGLEALAGRPEAALVKEELGVLGKLVVQAAEAVETFAETLTGATL